MNLSLDENEKGREGGVQIGDLVRLGRSRVVGQWQTPPFVMGNIFQGAPPILLLQKIHFLSLYSLLSYIILHFQFAQLLVTFFIGIGSCI